MELSSDYAEKIASGGEPAALCQRGDPKLATVLYPWLTLSAKRHVSIMNVNNQRLQKCFNPQCSLL
jgi:hypothetical protein